MNRKRRWCHTCTVYVEHGDLSRRNAQARWAPLLPRFVTTKARFSRAWKSDFSKRNVGSAFTLSARVPEGDFLAVLVNPGAAMMCAATVNWTLLADIRFSRPYVMLKQPQLVILHDLPPPLRFRLRVSRQRLPTSCRREIRLRCGIWTAWRTSLESSLAGIRMAARAGKSRHALRNIAAFCVKSITWQLTSTPVFDGA